MTNFRRDHEFCFFGKEYTHDLRARLSRTQQTERENGFLLCMLSPVWRAKLCGEVGTNVRQTLSLGEEDASLFSKVVALGCGRSVTVSGGVEELIGLASIADRYQVEAIQGYVEKAVVHRLTVEGCGCIMTTACGSGLVQMERASRRLALRKFDQFVECARFKGLSEEVLGSLLDDDALVSESEERVLKGVVRWMKGETGGVIRGEGLLRKIRFPFMTTEYLAGEARMDIPESVGLEGLVFEALLLKSIPVDLWAKSDLRYLDSKVLVPRRCRGVNWAEYEFGGERRLKSTRTVYSVSAHGRGFVCGGLSDGCIQVWNRATLEVERILYGHDDRVRALLSVGEWLISGSSDDEIRVWDVATGYCEGTLLGHTDTVRCLAVCGDRLVSGSWDRTAKVWTMEGAVSTWRCERTFVGHGHQVICVATWGHMMASGSADSTIRVWDVGAGTHEQTMVGHANSVLSLVACGQRLISSSLDKTVKVWSMATWACVHTVEACGTWSDQFIGRLAVSGSTLIGGSYECSESSDPEVCQVQVWDLDTLESLHRLWIGDGYCVRCLLSDGDEVWGAIGREVVAWGLRG
jgi:WD40 repeat protein